MARKITVSSPNDIRKLLVLITGIVLLGVGVYMILNQVTASGKINLNFNVFSGQVESGSAGVLIIFIALFLIVFTIIGKSTTTVISYENENEVEHIIKTKHMGRYIVLLVFQVLIVISLILIGMYNNKDP